GVCRTEQEILTKGAALMQKHQLSALLITRSEQGMTLLQQNQEPLHLPAQAREVFDVTGAGDTVIAVLAAAVAAGQSLAQATRLANVAAGLVVAKLGAQSVTVAELENEIHTQHAVQKSIVTEKELLKIRQAAKTQGETIVMTNGCFDILHAGHISYLTEAKALGDRLIVAVNDDASVKRLKGDSRPIVPLAQRMAVLAGLKAVDFVIAFSEDTPEKLISAILPDVLVKGGDYKPEQIAGAKAVTAAGGEVKILSFEDGCSTSNLINKIKHGE
ncbi:MAG: D-glycero-beta-D-manno-heptose 1-phosphate adenylyltransferase, partial [Gammaproteobacteria bacterium]|nr:D-glycero-beta-D-manno-heptose 1-phosphate adenylyltransferase [Gammaproteobacteria bacterium]